MPMMPMKGEGEGCPTQETRRLTSASRVYFSLPVTFFSTIYATRTQWNHKYAINIPRTAADPSAVKRLLVTGDTAGGHRFV